MKTENCVLCMLVAERSGINQVFYLYFHLRKDTFPSVKGLRDVIQTSDDACCTTDLENANLLTKCTEEIRHSKMRRIAHLFCQFVRPNKCINVLVPKGEL